MWCFGFIIHSVRQAACPEVACSLLKALQLLSLLQIYKEMHSISQSFSFCTEKNILSHAVCNEAESRMSISDPVCYGRPKRHVSPSRKHYENLFCKMCASRAFNGVLENPEPRRALRTFFQSKRAELCSYCQQHTPWLCSSCPSEVQSNSHSLQQHKTKLTNLSCINEFGDIAFPLKWTPSTPREVGSPPSLSNLS